MQHLLIELTSCICIYIYIYTIYNMLSGYFNIYKNYKNWKLKRHVAKFGSKNNGYFNYFNQEWFEEHQEILIWLLNHWLLKYWFRWILRIHKDCKFSEYIDEIKPNTYRIKISENTYRSDFRTHQKFSKRIYYTFRPVWWFAHFFDWVLLDRFELVPSFGFDTLTVYPDASPETNSVDGIVIRVSAASTFSVLRNGDGIIAITNTTPALCAYLETDDITSKYVQLHRSIFIFYHQLPALATVSSAVFSLYGSSSYGEMGIGTNASLHIVSNLSSGTNVLYSADYAYTLFGTTSFANVSYATFNLSGYNDFNLSSAGITHLTYAGDGRVRYGARLGWDMSNTTTGLTWGAFLSQGYSVIFAEATGTSSDPKLVVTYTLPTAIKAIFGIPIADIKTINGIAGASIKSIMGLTYVQPVLWYGERGVFGGGYSSGGVSNILDYIIISTPGNTTDFGDLLVARYYLSSCSNGIRGVFGGGYNVDNTIEYITIATTGNAIDFGDLTIGRYTCGGCSNGTRGVFGGGYSVSALSNVLDYITITTTSNATDFGDLTVARAYIAACSNSLRGILGGDTGVGNTIDYITIATLGDATDFGDLTVGRNLLAACSSATRGVFGGGYSAGYNVLDYITIASTGNATDFGDLSFTRYSLTACSNNVIGMYAGGYGGGYSNVLDYITIASTGNATDFGDLTVARYGPAACSGN